MPAKPKVQLCGHQPNQHLLEFVDVCCFVFPWGYVPSRIDLFVCCRVRVCYIYPSKAFALQLPVEKVTAENHFEQSRHRFGRDD